jgi:hypothetical protein
MSVLRLCKFCRHQVVPVRPQPFAAISVRSAGATGSVSKYLQDELAKRQIEQQRVAEGYPLDYEPRYFPWCSKLTLSREKAEEILAELEAADDRQARAELEAGRIVIDYANGYVLPIYVTCARGNPNGECAEFEAHRSPSVP